MVERGDVKGWLTAVRVLGDQKVYGGPDLVAQWVRVSPDVSRLRVPSPSGHIQESSNECMRWNNISLSLSSLSPSLSLSLYNQFFKNVICRFWSARGLGAPVPHAVQGSMVLQTFLRSIW